MARLNSTQQDALYFNDNGIWHQTKTVLLEWKEELMSSKVSLALLFGLSCCLLFLGADGFHYICGIIIHTIGLLHPLLCTFKLLKHLIDTSSTKSTNSSQNTNIMDTNTQEECVTWLKFWVTYCSSWFVLSCLIAPALNFFLPAKLFTNIFFLFLTTQPETFGTTIFDKCVFPLLKSNYNLLERVHSSLNERTNQVIKSGGDTLTNFFTSFIPSTLGRLLSNLNLTSDPAQFNFATATASGHNSPSIVHAVSVPVSTATSPIPQIHTLYQNDQQREQQEQQHTKRKTTSTKQQTSLIVNQEDEKLDTN